MKISNNKHISSHKSIAAVVLAALMLTFTSCGNAGAEAGVSAPELTEDDTSKDLQTETTEEVTAASPTDEASTASPAAETTTASTAEEIVALSEAPDDTTADNTEQLKEETEMSNPTLLYQGHASLRIVTGEGKVIYIDPFAGEGYDLPADIILQTHGHFDHGDMGKIASQNAGCTVITHKEAVVKDDHKFFDFGYVQVEAVEAGYNKNHDKKNCVGYILTFSNGVTLYVSGDTSKTEQMPELKEKDLDYAFFCCDGVYNMDVNEAKECAELVGAKVSIPYHTGSASVTPYDADNAALFDVPGALLLKPGEELELK